jgi:hypothetical protein
LITTVIEWVHHQLIDTQNGRRRKAAWSAAGGGAGARRDRHQGAVQVSEGGRRPLWGEGPRRGALRRKTTHLHHYRRQPGTTYSGFVTYSQCTVYIYMAGQYMTTTHFCAYMVASFLSIVSQIWPMSIMNYIYLFLYF